MRQWSNEDANHSQLEGNEMSDRYEIAADNSKMDYLLDKKDETIAELLGALEYIIANEDDVGCSNDLTVVTAESIDQAREAIKAARGEGA